LHVPALFRPKERMMAHRGLNRHGLSAPHPKAHGPTNIHRIIWYINSTNNASGRHENGGHHRRPPRRAYYHCGVQKLNQSLPMTRRGSPGKRARKFAVIVC
jgi:hypothetical protein